MEQPGVRTIAVVGATGLQGGAVTRRLLQEDWAVRALTRNADQKKARLLAQLGAQIVHADTSDPASVDRAFEGVHGVFNVQNHHISGYDGELAQGKNVADAAKRAGVAHLVYGAAGLGTVRTGVGSWDVKLDIAEHMRSIDLPVTVLRPMAFMELMTASKFYPQASTWHVMPKLMGWSRPVGWLAVDDLGAIVARAFAEPDRFLGLDLGLSSDVQSLEQSREIWRDVNGRPPRRFPMPVWLFRLFVGTDEITMWRWLRSNEIDLGTETTREVHPGAMTVREWLERKRGQTRAPSATSVHRGAADAARKEGSVAHPNVERLHAFVDAYAAGDRETLGRSLAEDAVWHVGGTHRFSGDYRGRDAILDYFDTVARETGSSLKLEPRELLANNERGAAFLRVTGERAGRTLDAMMAEAFVFGADGTISEFWAHATDQDAIDRFWE